MTNDSRIYRLCFLSPFPPSTPRQTNWSKASNIHARVIPHKTPELVYPRESIVASKAFSFTTIGGPLWVISFENGDASYDIMSDLKATDLPKYKFSGLGVTIKDGETQLRHCDPGAVVMDMGLLNDSGYFPQTRVCELLFVVRINFFFEFPIADTGDRLERVDSTHWDAVGARQAQNQKSSVAVSKCLPRSNGTLSD